MDKGFIVKYKGKTWTPKILARHAAKGKGITWAEDRIIKVQRGEMKMKDVLEESQLPGGRRLRMQALVYLDSDNNVYTVRKIINHLKKHYGQDISPQAAAVRIRNAQRDPKYDEKLLLPNHNIPRQQAPVPEKLKKEREYRAECRRREQDLLALEDPREQEKWDIQNRVLNSY